MDTPVPTPQPSGGRCGHTHRHGFRFGRALFIIGVAAAAGFAGGYAGKSFAQGFGPRPMLGAPLDPAKMNEHVERMVRHFAVEVDATPEQKQRLTVIAQDLARDMAPQRDRLRAARQRGIELLGAPAIDRAAIESLRAEQLALAEAGSKRLTQALADAAEVLTPEQRVKLAERMKSFGERRGWPRHG